MPRFFFDSHDGETLSEDHAGVECDDIEAARVEAQRTLADLVRDVVPDGKQRTIALRVRDETGRTVVKAAVSILVEVEP